MRISTLLSIFSAVGLVAARSTRHVRKKDFQKPAARLEARQPVQQGFPQFSQHQNQKRQSSYLNENSQSNCPRSYHVLPQLISLPRIRC